MRYLPTIISIIEVLLLIVPVILTVAFVSLPLQSRLNYISIVKKSVKESFTIKNIFTIFIFVILATFSRFIFAQYNISDFIDLFALITISFSTDMLTLPVEGLPVEAFKINKPITVFMMEGSAASGVGTGTGTGGGHN
jgi:hypothetical protein